MNSTNNTKYVITASNHGLGNIPCNINQTLFGKYAANGEHDDAEASREFDTKEQAEAALRELETTGDWDEMPDYEIAEVA